MSVLLTHTVLLPLALLVTVPVLLHLFARTRPPVYQFSSIEFILKIVRTTMRVKRPQDWLLLVLRTLAIAALVLLFLQPLLLLKGLGGRFGRRNVVVVVDRTASMGCMDGAQTRFAAACGAASEILGGLKSSDRVNLVWLDAQPDAAFPEMGSNAGYLQGALKQARSSHEAGNIPAGLHLAANLLKECEGYCEIAIVSDFQASAWTGVEASLPANVKVVRLKVGEDTPANTAITSLRCEPAQPLLGQATTVFCDVANYSAQPRRTEVYLTVGERRLRQALDLPAWGSAAAAFPLDLTDAAPVTVAAAIDEDAFGADDRRWTLVEPRAAIRIGILAQDTQTAEYWQRGLRALAWAEVSRLNVSELAGDLPFDILMLSGWQGAHSTRLRAFVNEGGCVICYPSPALPPPTLNELLHHTAAAPTQPATLQELTPPRRLKVANPQDEIFRLFADGEYGDLAAGRFHRRLKLQLPAGEQLLQFEDGPPALVRYRNGGTVLLWNLPLGREQSDWASRAEYLLFLGELMLCHRPIQARTPETVPGSVVNWAPEIELGNGAVTLLADGTTTVPIRELTGERGREFQSVDPPGPGVYRWTHQGRTLGHSVVNFPPVESDLRALSTAALTEDGGVTMTGGEDVRALREGIRLWPWLLLVTMVLLLAESAAASWTERT